MRRRAFMAALGAAAAWPLYSRARQGVPRIGFLGPTPPGASFEAFQAGLRALGYVPGETVEIESRFGDGQDERMARLARELVDLEVDLLVTWGPGVVAAHRVTRTIPIVVATAGDPVAAGLDDDLDNPGGNVTGQSFLFNKLVVKRVALIKQAAPAMTSVGLLVVKDAAYGPLFLRAVEAPAEALGVAIKPIEVTTASDCDDALSAIPAGAIGGLVVTDPFPFLPVAAAGAIAAAAARHRLPAAGPLSLARNGGLLGYGVDFLPTWRLTANLVDKILKRAKPHDATIDHATFITIVNLRTARALGLEIPPALLAAADEVIE